MQTQPAMLRIVTPRCALCASEVYIYDSVFVCLHVCLCASDGRLRYTAAFQGSI